MPDSSDLEYAFFTTSWENSSQGHVFMNINIPTIYIICKYTVCQTITQTLAHCTVSGLDPTYTHLRIYMQ